MQVSVLLCPTGLLLWPGERGGRRFSVVRLHSQRKLVTQRIARSCRFTQSINAEWNWWRFQFCLLISILQLGWSKKWKFCRWSLSISADAVDVCNEIASHLSLVFNSKCWKYERDHVVVKLAFGEPLNIRSGCWTCPCSCFHKVSKWVLSGVNGQLFATPMNDWSGDEFLEDAIAEYDRN